MLRESLNMRIDLLGPGHPGVAGSMTLLANCLIANGALDEALELATKARGIYTEALSGDHWRTAVAIGAEGAALAGLGKYADAEERLLQSHTILRQDPNAMTIFVSEATRRLASLYSAWGKPVRAAEFRALLGE
jgi:tetratricopeptide (TPR) repeat protein